MPAQVEAGFIPVDVDNLYSSWYYLINIMANPEVEVWLPNGWWAGMAEEVTDAGIRMPLLRQVLIDSGLAARAAGIDPATVTNEELDTMTSGYRLIHIRRTEPRTSPGGPGDLSWVWPLVTMILLPLVLFRRKR